MNYNIIGIGIAVTFSIISLSAIILYLAFRVKETFREEKSVKIQAVKTIFLIGILFLASGMFYFFAQAMYQPEKFDNQINNNQTPGPEIPGKNTSVFLGLSYQENIKTGEEYTISFKIYNPSKRTIRNATIKSVGLSLFEAKSNFDIGSDILYLGDIPPGDKSGYLQLKAGDSPRMVEGMLILMPEDMEPVSETVKINILKIVPTPTPTPSTPSWPWYVIWKEPSSQQPTVSSNPSPTPTPVPTPTPTLTAIPTPAPTPTTIPTLRSTPTVVPTPVPTPTPAPTAAPTPTSTPTAISTPTPAPTATPIPTPAPTATPIPTPTPTSIPTPTPIPTAIPTPTPIPTAMPTSTPAPTTIPTPTPAPTAIPTSAPAPTTIPTPTPTPAPVTTPTPTPTDSTI